MQRASEIRPDKLFIKKKSSSMCRGGCTDLLLLLILLLFSKKSFLIASHAVWLPIVIGIDFALSKTKNRVVKRTTPHSPQGHPKNRSVNYLFGRPLIPYNFLKGIVASNFCDMGNLRPSVFGLTKMSFQVPKKGQLRFSERK